MKMNTLIKWFAKKYAVNIVNDMLKSISEKTDIQKYKDKTNMILEYLTNLMKVLEDNQVTNEEAEKIIDKTKEFFK
jgi:DNA mismatch repair ATPase MutL